MVSFSNSANGIRFKELKFLAFGDINVVHSQGGILAFESVNLKYSCL